MAVEENCIVDGRESSVAMASNCQYQNGGILSVGRLVVATNGTSPATVMGVREEPAIDTNNNNNNSGEDDELTSLTWLQDTNLLKNFQMGACGIEGEDVFSDTPSSDYLDETIEHITLEGSIVEEEPLSNAAEQPLITLPSSGHMPYNPTLHANSKPPYSFSCLIFMAIEDSINKALPVKDIYNWILTHFPYFQNAPTGWKNSVRHNLSLSKCFRKVDKEKGQNIGKGSLWCIDPEFRPNLIQALQKAPSMANMEFSQLSSTFCENGKSESDIKPCLLVSSQQAIKIPPPELFPYLSRRLAASNVKDSEVDAAATMLALKNGPCMTIQNFSEESESDTLTSIQRRLPRKRLKLKHGSYAPVSKKVKVAATTASPVPPVITSSPSEDHTYSASLSQTGSSSPSSLSPISNELRDWSEGEKYAANNGFFASASPTTTFERSVPTREFEDMDDYDDSSAAEGAHALMNLAKIATKRLLKNNMSS